MAGVVWSDPFRGASNLAGRSNVRTIVATKFYHPRETDLRESWECRAGQHSVKANVDILVWNFLDVRTPRGRRGRHVRKECAAKARNHSRVASALPHSEDKISNQGIHAAEFEIAPVDQSDLFGLTLHDGNLAVIHVVAEGEGTADPEALALGGCDLVPDPLRGDLAFELRKRQQHIERQ